MWPKADDIRARCGPYQIAAVLRERGVDKDLDDLYISARHRKYDWSLPWNVAEMLRRHGVDARWRFVFKNAFAEELRRAAQRGAPVLFVIRSIHGRGNPHWISSRGYDASTDEFLCYDSQYESADNDWGNIRYPASTLLTALPWYGTFIVILND